MKHLTTFTHEYIFHFFFTAIFVNTCSNLWVQNSSQFSTEMESCKAIPEVLLIRLFNIVSILIILSAISKNT